MGVRAIPSGERVAHFGRDRGALATRVLGRAAIGEQPVPGPLVIEEYDSTTVVPPGWTALRGVHGFVYLEKQS
jgi:N-methylhydantoinase A